MTITKEVVSSPAPAGNIHQNEEDHLLVEPEAPPLAVAVPVKAFPVNAVPVVAHDSMQYTNGAFVVGKNGSSSSNFVEADSMPRLPCRVDCHLCGAKDVITVTNEQASLCTMLSVLALCIICCPCACVPFCIKDCNSVTHKCPECNRTLCEVNPRFDC